MPNLRGRSNTRGRRAPSFSPIRTAPALRGTMAKLSSRLSALSLRPKARSSAPSRRPAPKRRSGAMVSTGLGITDSKSSASLKGDKLAKGLRKVGTPIVFSSCFGVRSDADAGFQGIFGGETSLSYPNNGFALAQNDALQFIYTNYVVPNVQNLTPNVPGKYVLESALAHLTFTNSSLAQAECDIYEFVANRDVDARVAYTIPSGLIDAASVPGDLWKKGATLQNNNSASALISPATFVGANPMDASWIRQYFKMKKCVRVQLAPGATHRHEIKVRFNKLIDGALVNQSAVGYTGVPRNWRGLTRYYMVVHRGFPVSGSADENAVVTTADTHIDFVWDCRYTFTYVINNQSLVYNTDGLQTLAAEPRVVTTFGTQITPNIPT